MRVAQDVRLAECLASAGGRGPAARAGCRSPAATPPTIGAKTAVAEQVRLRDTGLARDHRGRGAAEAAGREVLDRHREDLLVPLFGGLAAAGGGGHAPRWRVDWSCGSACRRWPGARSGAAC